LKKEMKSLFVLRTPHQVNQAVVLDINTTKKKKCRKRNI
jgi:hypothetical protein